MLTKLKFKRGFTIIEMAIVAPIVVLTISAFITIIVSLIGDAVADRQSNLLSYNLQDALSRIETDIKYSNQFLEQNDISLTLPQGANNDTTVFKNVTSSSTALILNANATTENPSSATGSFLYLANSPNACSSVDKVKNTVMTYNVVYFVSNNTLWRRTIMPANYLTAGCNTPWQQPSCAIGQTASFCKTQDIKVLENITNFSLTYYNGSNSDTILTDAADYTKADSVRKTALASADTVKVGLNSQATASGKTISKDTSLRINRLPEFKQPTAIAYNEATGGTITEFISTGQAGTTIGKRYRVHTFTSSGTFNITKADKPFDVLVVGGGGSGGSVGQNMGSGAGGGAGGLVYSSGQTISVGSYSITVGAGGTSPGSGSNQGNNGGNSSFGSLIIATGGGGGGSGSGSGGGVSRWGNNGGSGGGGGYSDGGGSGGGTGVSGQGNNGGWGAGGSPYGAGGGGGAGSVGGSGHGGAGGSGIASSINGINIYYAGGGGGGGEYISGGAGGNGGGGRGAQMNVNYAVAGTPNTGGGGGGGSNSGFYAGAAGGSGIVIIRYEIQS